jgi:hypothetical protein
MMGRISRVFLGLMCMSLASSSAFADLADRVRGGERRGNRDSRDRRDGRDGKVGTWTDNRHGVGSRGNNTQVDVRIDARREVGRSNDHANERHDRRPNVYRRDDRGPFSGSGWRNERHETYKAPVYSDHRYRDNGRDHRDYRSSTRVDTRVSISLPGGRIEFSSGGRRSYRHSHPRQCHYGNYQRPRTRIVYHSEPDFIRLPSVERLGAAELTDRLEQETIDVDRYGFRAIKIHVTQNDADIERVIVVYSDGSSEDLPVQENFLEGDWSGWAGNEWMYLRNCEGKKIDSIVVIGDSNKGRHGPLAIVDVYGLR